MALERKKRRGERLKEKRKNNFKEKSACCGLFSRCCLVSKQREQRVFTNDVTHGDVPGRCVLVPIQGELGVNF